MKTETPPISRIERSARLLAAACAATLLAALALALQGAAPVAAQQADGCAPIELGALGENGQDTLRAEGRWTTDDCDSRFLTDSDAHTYRFRLAQDGQVRVDLASRDADAYLHLLAEDGGRIVHDDDTGPGLDARIEFDLAAGAYMVEAASGAGRIRGPADFTLTVHLAANCAPIDLGALEPGDGLRVSGEWTRDDCGARFRLDTPAHTFRFRLPEEGLVRIDLTSSEQGDPYAYLLSEAGEFIYSDDDGGAGRNSRIENDLAPGVYLIEAATYADRDHAHALTEFDLRVRLIDEDGFNLKAEALHIPDEVVAGEAVRVNYRAGNAGRTDLPEGYSAAVRLYARGAYASTGQIEASDGRWSAGVSYHSDPESASLTSEAIGEAAPFEVAFRGPGRTWAFLAVIIYDDEGAEVGFRGILKEFITLSGFVFDAVTVQVDGEEYEVAAVADAEGVVTTSVIAAAAPPDAEVDDETRAKAVYAAGALTQLLEGVLQRPALTGLPTDAQPAAVSVSGPSSGAMLRLLGGQYADALAASGLPASLAGGEAVNPVAVEDLLQGMGETAEARYAALAASWRGLQDRVEGGAALSFAEARAFHAQLVYAERIIAPLAAAGEAVSAARGRRGGLGRPRRSGDDERAGGAGFLRRRIRRPARRPGGLGRGERRGAAGPGR